MANSLSIKNVLLYTKRTDSTFANQDFKTFSEKLLITFSDGAGVTLFSCFSVVNKRNTFLSFLTNL